MCQNFSATQIEGIGVAEDGREEVLGLWLGEKEGVRYGLKARGQDILIAVVGWSEGLFGGLGDGVS